MVWPASTVEMLVPLNKLPAAPPSVKVGFDPVAVKFGASLIDVIAITTVSDDPFTAPSNGVTVSVAEVTSLGAVVKVILLVLLR